MLWPSNLEQVFGPYVLLWPMPIRFFDKGKGLYYPKIPEITMGDMNILLKDTSRAYNTNFTTDEFEVNPKDYIKKAVEKYEGHQFIVHFGEGDEKTVSLK